MKILVTGSAGFIGSATALKLLDRGDYVIGVDNHNNYYDTKIKDARVKRKQSYSKYFHYKIDLCDQKSLKKMGMFDEAGGRANVPPKGQKYKPKPKPKSDTEKLMDESRKKYKPKPKTLPGAPPRDYNPRKKSPPKKMKPMKVYKTAKGGRIDGIAIRGKTKGTIR